MTTQQQQILAECQTILAQCRISANQAATAAAQIGSEGLATLESPIFTGNPQAPTPAQNNASASIATTNWMAQKFGVPFGVATLDNTGVVPVSQLPFTALTFDGNWNAATNTPTLSSSSGTVGHFRIVSVAGSTTLNGISSWGVGDQALFGAGVWQKVPYTAPPISNLPLSTLEGIASNTFVGNTMGGSASPQAIPIVNLFGFASDFHGATSGTAGSRGFVPGPLVGGTGLFLSSNGSWTSVPVPDLTAYATLASPAFTGTATVSTQARGNFGSAIASTAFVSNQLARTADGTALIKVNGTVSMGTSTYGAAIDHIHGTDLSRAPVVAANPGNCGYFTNISASQVKFYPYNGNVIRIAGTYYVIPGNNGSGVVAGNTSTFLNGVAGQNLAVNTTYFVYCFNNSGTLALDFSTTTYATDFSAGNEGTVIKTGDSSRTLVGMVRTNASAQFQNDATHINVISWFNKVWRRGLVGIPNVSSASAVPIDLGGGVFNIQFCCWGPDFPSVEVSLQIFLSAGLAGRAAIAWVGLSNTTAVSSTAVGIGTTGCQGNAMGWPTPAAGLYSAVAVGESDGADNTCSFANIQLWVTLWG